MLTGALRWLASKSLWMRTFWCRSSATYGMRTATMQQNGGGLAMAKQSDSPSSSRPGMPIQKRDAKGLTIAEARAQVEKAARFANNEVRHSMAADPRGGVYQQGGLLGGRVKEPGRGL